MVMHRSWKNGCSGLGYTVDPDMGAYQHADRRAVLVCDLIDRGPEQLRVLEIVKALVDSGNARIVMGQSRIRCDRYASEDPLRPSEHCRPHTEKITDQHQAFLDQLSDEQRKH